MTDRPVAPACHPKSGKLWPAAFLPSFALPSARPLVFAGCQPMELDLLDVHFDVKQFKPRELEEALEDPFAVRFRRFGR